MNLVKRYLGLDKQEEFIVQMVHVTRQLQWVAYTMMIVYMGIGTWKMYLVVEKHQYLEIVGILTNAFLFWLMTYVMKILRKANERWRKECNEIMTKR